jgi:hypothetical protein
MELALSERDKPAAAMLVAGAVYQMVRMAQPVTTQQQTIPAPQPSRGVASAIVLGAAGLGAAAVLGAAVLWFHYGTAVFFEMIASGIAACF